MTMNSKTVRMESEMMGGLMLAWPIQRTRKHWLNHKTVVHHGPSAKVAQMKQQITLNELCCDSH